MSSRLRLMLCRRFSDVDSAYVCRAVFARRDIEGRHKAADTATTETEILITISLFFHQGRSQKYVLRRHKIFIAET